METEDSYISGFNMSSTIRSNTRFTTLFPDDYEVWVLHFEDYITRIEKHGSYIGKSITVVLHKFMKMKEHVYSLVE